MYQFFMKRYVCAAFIGLSLICSGAVIMPAGYAQNAKPNNAKPNEGQNPSLLVQEVKAPIEAQTQADAFTRYELLAPESQSFRIYYAVSATRAGAEQFYNQIRPGSEPDVHGVYDRASGKKLKWSLVDGVEARASGLIPQAAEDSEYIKVNLARPVPEKGRGRLLIDKTYKDPASYYAGESGSIIFSRTLGVKRNAVVLPFGYELVSVNYPSQMIERKDGRLEISFINPGTVGVPYEVVARRVSAAPKAAAFALKSAEYTSGRPTARLDFDIAQRASQTRDIVYFLQQPESHSFRLYHDYEEMRPGTDRYLNIVRPGSRASNPSAKILDSGESLKVETLRGVEISEREIEIGEPVTANTELVAIWFDPVKKGTSKLIRIEETYTDESRYFLTSPNQFLWDRSFGRSRNRVKLPPGWFVTELAVPAIISTDEAGLVTLDFINDRPGVINVLIKGRRRAS